MKKNVYFLWTNRSRLNQFTCIMSAKVKLVFLWILAKSFYILEIFDSPGSLPVYFDLVFYNVSSLDMSYQLCFVAVVLYRLTGKRPILESTPRREIFSTRRLILMNSFFFVVYFCAYLFVCLNKLLLSFNTNFC